VGRRRSRIGCDLRSCPSGAADVRSGKLRDAGVVPHPCQIGGASGLSRGDWRSKLAGERGPSMREWRPSTTRAADPMRQPTLTTMPAPTPRRSRWRRGRAGAVWVPEATSRAGAAWFRKPTALTAVMVGDEFPGQGRSCPRVEPVAGAPRTSDLTPIRAGRCRDICPGQRVSSALTVGPVPRRSRDDGDDGHLRAPRWPPSGRPPRRCGGPHLRWVHRRLFRHLLPGRALPTSRLGGPSGARRDQGLRRQRSLHRPGT
jgi:hypothetical protein